MSEIDLYQVLRQIPNVTDEQAKQAAAGAYQTAAGPDQTERLHRIETELTELRVVSRITLGLQLVILAILLVPLVQ